MGESLNVLCEGVGWMLKRKFVGGFYRGGLYYVDCVVVTKVCWAF